MKVQISVSLLCSFIILTNFNVSSYAEEKKYTLSLQFENDSFGGTDRHFSHGTRIEFLTDQLLWITRMADKLPWFDSSGNNNSQDELEVRGSISIGQNIYTPGTKEYKGQGSDDIFGSINFSWFL